VLEHLNLRLTSRRRLTNRHRPRRSNATYLSRHRISRFLITPITSSAIQRSGTVGTIAYARPEIRHGASSARFNERRWRCSELTTTVVQRSRKYASQLKRLRPTKYSSTGFATTTIYRRRGSKTLKPYFMSRVSGLRSASGDDRTGVPRCRLTTGLSRRRAGGPRRNRDRVRAPQLSRSVIRTYKNGDGC